MIFTFDPVLARLAARADVFDLERSGVLRLNFIEVKSFAKGPEGVNPADHPIFPAGSPPIEKIAQAI